MSRPVVVPVLTIDGPSGSGKSTVSRLVAECLGWRLLDSGALYRAVGYAAGAAGLDWADADALEWAKRRGSRSGRVAWQYVTELAGRAGRAI